MERDVGAGVARKSDSATVGRPGGPAVIGIAGELRGSAGGERLYEDACIGRSGGFTMESDELAGRREGGLAGFVGESGEGVDVRKRSGSGMGGGGVDAFQKEGGGEKESEEEGGQENVGTGWWIEVARLRFCRFGVD